MTYEEFEKAVKALGQKIGFSNKPCFVAVHKMLSEGENIKGAGSCVDMQGDGAIIITERNFYAAKKISLISFDNTVIPLEKITSFSSSGIIPKLMVSEGTLVHTYSTVNNVDKILAAIKAGKSAPAPEVPPVKQQDATDELRKLKSLLDDGIITQEDFDKKKAQLLGL
jgi:hypothetical protein